MNMKDFKTEQESFWSGQFGDSYIQRNQSKELLASNLHFFSHVLDKTKSIGSVLELGCNVGMNLRALTLLLPNSTLTGVEINENAAKLAGGISDDVSIHHGSILEFSTEDKFDLVFTKGVLIHLAPEVLSDVYRTMGNVASRYVLIAEYFNPAPVSIDYRGHQEKLYKRDFAAEFLEVNPEFELVDYKFHYKKAVNFSQDDITWFLMERK
jgi:spore coat polysaccharide biosynthesis protein SpsF